jgi:hypothetical protein
VVKRIKTWLFDIVTDACKAALRANQVKTVSAIQRGSVAEAYKKVKDVSLRVLNDRSTPRSFELGNTLYEVQIALAALKPLETQALAMQETQSENLRLKRALVLNAKAHETALRHLVRSLPENDPSREAYLAGADKLRQQISENAEQA